jgi:hypothetical protein
MKIWLVVLLGCCGCLDDALPQTDMGPDGSGLTICEKTETGNKSIIWEGEMPQVQCLADYGGGWLLVGRSGRTPDGRFGWLESQGTLDNDSAAYSLGVEFKFTEILVVAGDLGKVVSGDFAEVGRIQVGSKDFVSDSSLRSVRPVQVLSFSEDCQGEPIPSAFYALGQTGLPTLFGFGESDGPGVFITGFYPDGWHFDGSSCQRDGNFGGRDGAIYVRALKEKP